jgi:hypothetical protein
VWPWEHLAFGYAFYSPARQLVRRGPPTPGEALALALGTQLPDLIDKPLAWTVRILPSSVSLAHSAFFTLPLVAVARGVSRRIGRPYLWIPLTVGFLSHLLGDAVARVALRDATNLSFLVWPLVPSSAPRRHGLRSNFVRFLRAYARGIRSGKYLAYFLAELGLIAFALGRWVLDGTPGVPRGRDRGGPK